VDIELFMMYFTFFY